jgi:hypothetical protein
VAHPLWKHPATLLRFAHCAGDASLSPDESRSSVVTTRKSRKHRRRKFTGVFFIPCKQKWDAVVRLKRRVHHLRPELFDTEAEAANAIAKYLHLPVVEVVAPEPATIEEVANGMNRKVPGSGWSTELFPDRVVHTMRRTWDAQGTVRSFYLYAAAASAAEEIEQ